MAVSIRMPTSLRSFTHTSLGHLRPTRCSPVGSRLSATVTPTASDRPDQSAGASGRPSEKVSEADSSCCGALCQGRPSRPRPAVWRSATSSTGSTRPARARRISSVLVESISATASTAKPGRSGATESAIRSSNQLAEVLPMVSPRRTRPSWRISSPPSFRISCRLFYRPFFRLLLCLLGFLLFGLLLFGLLRLLLLFLLLVLILLGRQQRAAAFLGAAPARKFGQELGRVRLVDDQAVVVVELFAGGDVSQRLDINAPIDLVGFAVRFARVVDPARVVALDVAVDHTHRRRCGVEGVVGWAGSCGCGAAPPSS
jgi:hypothetical protein